MIGLYLLLPTLLVILVSFLIVRAAAIALMMTGMDAKRARFQALSAFSGTGFTTKEAENIVNHPQRRKIVTWLMIIGNAGIVAVIVTATTTLASTRGSQLPINALLLVIGILLVYKVATNRGFIRKWEHYVEEKLVKSHAFEEGTTEDLLRFIEGYGLVRTIVTDQSPFVNQSLAQTGFSQKNLLILGIERGKEWIPVPAAQEIIRVGDRLVTYGRLDLLRDTFNVEQ
jgi:hypothetical protein